MWFRNKTAEKDDTNKEPLPRISRIVREAQQKGSKKKLKKKEISAMKRQFQTELATNSKTQSHKKVSVKSNMSGQHSVKSYTSGQFSVKSNTSGLRNANGLMTYDGSSDGQIASSSTETTGSTAEYTFGWDVDGEPTDTQEDHHDDFNCNKNFNRQKWPRRAEFLLILVGFTVGLGNVWRFPYLCHKNGGASFLIPYFVFLFAEGIPLYYMELCLGQRLRKGSIGVWHIVSPYLDGLGIASSIVCFFVCLYYNVIVAWCLFYLANSFKDPLPWSVCPNRTFIEGNQTITRVVEECQKAGSTRYFWYRTTLNISDSIETGSSINWTLAMALLIAWILCWLCMLKGIKSEGKVVYFTATVPMILLAAMFFRGVHLPGFQEGLALLFIPDFKKLQDPLVWLDAASQTFYSLGIAYGTLIAFASYNPLKNDTTRDALLLCIIDCAVSVYASVVIFCFIGYKAHLQMVDCELEQATQLMNVTTKNVLSNLSTLSNSSSSSNFTCDKTKFLHELSQSTGLAFITFTEAINTLPYPQMWSILFFFMLFLLAIDTQFGMLEGLVTPVFDAKLFPKVRTEVMTGVICLTIYILSLTMVMGSGNYWFQLIEYYSAGIPLLVIALCQCLALSCVYGMEKFSNDIEYMTNHSPRKIWILCWKFVSPCLIIVVLIFSIHGLSTTTPMYKVWDAKLAKEIAVPWPPWAIFIGVALILVSILFIPVVAFLRYFKLIENGKNRLKFYFSKQRTSSRYGRYSVTEMENL